MKRLTAEQRAHIVTELACFRSPSQVVESFKARFGVEIQRQLVEHYDPGKNPASREKYGALFDETRRRWIAETDSIPVAHMRFRLQELHRLYRRALKMRHYVLAAQLLRQAAEEVGFVYTNHRIVTAGDPAQELEKLLGIPAAEIRALHDAMPDEER